VDLSTAKPTEALFRKAQDLGHGEQDMSAVVEVVRQERTA
jgi:3-hydroxyisobutyrate dehydrogenase-like beta-hydroxyacid dehydrogenase